MKIRIRPKAGKEIVWGSNALASFLIESSDPEKHKERIRKTYQEIFGEKPPEEVPAHLVRTAIFYEMSLRLDRSNNKDINPTFLKRHADALRFAAQRSLENMMGAEELLVRVEVYLSKRKDKEEFLEPVREYVNKLSDEDVARAFLDFFGEHPGRDAEMKKVRRVVLLWMQGKLLSRRGEKLAHGYLSEVERQAFELVRASNRQITKEEKSMAKKIKAKKKDNGSKGRGIFGKSGLNKTQFYIKSLRENEDLAPGKKQTDEQLQKVWDAEFPGKKSYPVNFIRRRWNGGAYGHDQDFVSTPAEAGKGAKKPAEKAKGKGAKVSAKEEKNAAQKPPIKRKLRKTNKAA